MASVVVETVVLGLEHHRGVDLKERLPNRVWLFDVPHGEGAHPSAFGLEHVPEVSIRGEFLASRTSRLVGLLELVTRKPECERRLSVVWRDVVGHAARQAVGPTDIERLLAVVEDIDRLLRRIARHLSDTYRWRADKSIEASLYRRYGVFERLVHGVVSLAGERS